MSILGNGVDIVKNSRIKKAIKNINFLNRIYTKKEIDGSKKILNKTNYFAKRFAAKEAFVKSIGMGFRNGINFYDISIKKKSSGEPTISVSNNIKQLIKKKFKINNFKTFLSLSDEDKYSIAFVKSLGTGFRHNLNFNDISVKNRTSGKPELCITSKVKELIKKKYKINRFKIFLSLSDEDKYSIAFVLIKIIK